MFRPEHHYQSKIVPSKQFWTEMLFHVEREQQMYQEGSTMVQSISVSPTAWVQVPALLSEANYGASILILKRG